MAAHASRDATTLFHAHASFLVSRAPWQEDFYNPDNSTDVDAYANNIVRKASYAIKRWGASMFYVDTTVNNNHVLPFEVWDKVAAALPHIIFFPEESENNYFSAAAPLQVSRRCLISPSFEPPILHAPRQPQHWPRVGSGCGAVPPPGVSRAYPVALSPPMQRAEQLEQLCYTRYASMRASN